MIARKLLGDGGVLLLVALLVVAAVLVPLANLSLPPDSPLHVSNTSVQLFGKYLAFAMLALSVDLV